jgi:N-acetylneuraminate synthase/N,N'-diacetyllegionaminate synthase
MAESQLAMLQKLELDLANHRELKACCDRLGIEFLSTPYSLRDIELLEDLGVSAFKVASGQIVEPDFLSAVARTGKPILLSTGMATLAEVDAAVRTLRAAGNDRLVLLQCTTNYPSRLEDANLRAIPTMAAAFGTVMGYSDHTCSDTACLVAVGLGARVFEKHLTLDKTMPGPDHAASATPDELLRLISAIREASQALGSGRKEPCPAEAENARNMRRSLVAVRRIRAGEVFTADMLACKRPATGIPPMLAGELLGRVAVCDIEADTQLDWSMCGGRS